MTDSIDNLEARERELSTEDLVQTRGAGGNVTTSDLAAEPVREEPRREMAAEAHEPLFPAEEAERLRARWTEVQTGFVDDPRRAVQDADGLIASSMKHLAETFAKARGDLEGQWDRGEDVSTEELRIALQKYRAFFGRLLAV